jgi:ribosomal protein S18 acetylase RimI-like enzyme
VAGVDVQVLRDSIRSGTVRLDATPLLAQEIESIGWSGTRMHLDNVLAQLQRAAAGEVDYLTLRAYGLPVAKAGIDLAKGRNAGVIWRLATHPQLQGLGLATRLIARLESTAVRRGVRRLRLGVEKENLRALRLYKHLGYQTIGESLASWMAESEDGSPFLYRTTCIEMVKDV